MNTRELEQLNNWPDAELTKVTAAFVRLYGRLPSYRELIGIRARTMASELAGASVEHAGGSSGLPASGAPLVMAVFRLPASSPSNAETREGTTRA